MPHLKPIASLALLWCFGCGAPDPVPAGLRGTYVEVSSDRAGLGGTRTATSPAILYLNRCRGGCFVEPGPDDSRLGYSSIVAFPAHFPEFPATDTTWNEMVRCVKELYLPFDIEVTDVDPGDAPHFMNIVAGTPALIGAPIDAGGIAPFACVPLENAISFTFAGLYGDRPEELCVVVGQESGHAFGLDHELLCQDPMTYLDPCGKHYFRRADAHCGEHSPRECKCGQPFQNSYLQLMSTFGPRPSRLNLPPSVRIVRPEKKAKVQPLFGVVVAATDDRVVDHVDLSVDGRPIGTSTQSPYVFTAPADLALGTHHLRAEAFDDEGTMQYATQEVELVEATPRPDAATVDVEEADRPEIIGIIDGGTSDAEELRTLNGSGCGCSETPRPDHGHPEVAGLSALLVFGLLRRRRPWLAAALLATLIACGSEDTFGNAGGTVQFRPGAGSELHFEPVILTKNHAANLRIVATNVGESPLAFGTIELTGPDRGSFNVLDHPRGLDPGKSREIWLQFVPPGALEARATLVIPTTDPQLPRAEFPVFGDARAPCQLVVTPIRQGFKLNEERLVDVIAAGLSPCTITRISADTEMFPLVDPPPLPTTIAPGGKLSLRIRHALRTTDPGPPTRRLIVFEADGSDATAELVGAPPVWNCVEVAPEQMQFPPTDTGFPTRARVVVRNQCADDQPSIVSAAVGLGADSFQFDGPALPVTLPPGGQAELWVRYNPSGIYAEDNGELHINTTDAALPQLTAKLTGVGRKSRVFVPPSLDFGTIPGTGPGICTSRVKKLPIFNFGAGRLRVEGLELMAGSDPGFHVVSVEIQGQSLDPRQPFTVASGTFAELRLELSPSSPGPVSGQLILHSSAENGDQTTVLLGRTASGGNIVEHFAITPPKLDVLFTVDDSLSAVAMRRRLLAAVPSWIAATRGIDQRIGVVRDDLRWPDGGWPLRCGVSPFLDSAALGPQALATGLSCLLNTSEEPATEVGGLLAAQHFFEHSLAPPDPPGSTNGAMGFLRDQARLVIISASDADDAGTESPALIARFFQALKDPDRPDRAVAHDITVTDLNLCTDLFPELGTRYQAVSLLTGGQSFNECAPSWDAALDAIGRAAAAPEHVYSLSQAATPGSLSVRLDGAMVIEDAIDGFTFDPRANTVRLHGAAAASSATDLEISYATECHPI
ncbi:MAG: Ig-like domain-containing protein [Myxococcota bacterium]